MKKFIKYIKEKIFEILLYFCMTAFPKGNALGDNGWFKSAITKKSIDKNGNPIPWCTYAYIEFVKPRLKKNMTVFEYGSGNSTLWYSERVKNIIAVEHNKLWYNEINQNMPSNSLLLLEENTDGYTTSILKQKCQFDIVIIDGEFRNECLDSSIKALNKYGVIIIDNSDRSDYEYSYKTLAQQNFNRLDFYGMGPINNYGWCTSIFYRKQNCLDI